MASHKFGIIEEFEETKYYYLYEPEKYNCISVNIRKMDYVIENFIEELGEIKTYLCISSRIFYGLDESGITILPSESLISFRNIIINANFKIKSTELINLLLKIDDAIRNNKHLIHFGISY